MLILGIGLASQNSAGDLLEALYQQPLMIEDADVEALKRASSEHLKLSSDSQWAEVSFASLQAFKAALAETAAGLASSIGELLEQYAATNTGSENRRQIMIAAVTDSTVAVVSTADAYLRLQALSHRLVKPHAISLEGIFAKLPNLAWTSEGPIDLEELPARRLAARAGGHYLTVSSVDKFPQMADYVVPAGVRIADTARVRLGAYLGEGTTVMHEGFVNFNGGTEGTSMIEGRVSAGVMVGEGSDLGGGCSTMGTLSGGGKMIISVGKSCLIGANAGIGIPLGDRCIVEAGLYLTAGAKVSVLSNDGRGDGVSEVSVVKARDLAGQSDLLFRRNSQNGRIEAVSHKTAIELNEMLHSHN